MSSKIFSLVVGILLITAHAAPITSSGGNRLLAFLSAYNTSVPQNATPTTVSESAAAASMEAAVTDLVLGKTAFGATPMGGSVKTIQKLLESTMMPKVTAAHKSDQRDLIKLANEMKKCGSKKNSGLKLARPTKQKYMQNSRLHKKCRGTEAVIYASKTSCLQQQKSLAQEKKLRCTLFAQISKKYSNQKDNTQVVKKAGSEKVEAYIRRISMTFCGSHVHGPKGRKSSKGGLGGGLPNSILDKYLEAKQKCDSATKKFAAKVKECKGKVARYTQQKSKCNQYQELMDGNSCKSAVLVKDACESYATCYFDKKKAYDSFASKSVWMERDRKAEWRGLKRMGCLIKAFSDGKVANKEVDACKKQSHSTKQLTLKYPKLPPLATCKRPTLYPSTGAYKRREVAPLPTMAKGKVATSCPGLTEVPTTPRKGSPKGTRCERVSLNGPYSAGALVKCTNGIDVYRSQQKSSCPRGTKIFSPASRNDWRTFLASALPLRAPNWIIDVTRPGDGSSGLALPMNSKTRQGATWKTSDGSPWWLRSSKFSEPNGDYKANCYLNLKAAPNVNSITFNDWNCKVHSKSYYCQPWKGNIKPKAGSPKACRCSRVELTGRYSAGSLVKCEQCLDVSKSTQRNSCPNGMKIFSPRSRQDWRTVLDSTAIPKAPHEIIDITRPQNGCGGCSKYPMKSSAPSQASWRTSDGSPWWLRNSKSFAEPQSYQKANCYLGINGKQSNPDNIQFKVFKKCSGHSKSYLCQPVRKSKKLPPKPKPQARVKVTNLYFLVQGVNKCPKESEKIKTQGDCKRIASKQGWEFGSAGSWATLPTGCWRWTTNNPNHGKVYFNSNSGKTSSDGAILCKKVGRTSWKATIPKGNLVKSSTACDSFTKFRKGVALVGNVQISAGGQTRSCNKASIANQILDKFKKGQSGTWTCDGQTWRVGNCGGPTEINVGCSGICGCKKGCVVVRPCIGNLNWGGFSNTCSSARATLSVSTSKR